MSKLKKLINNLFTTESTHTQLPMSSIHSIARTSSDHPGSKSRHVNDARHVGNDLLIWLDGNLEEVNNNHCCNSITQLRRIFKSIHFLKDCDQCLDFLNDIIDEKVFMVISGTLGQNIVPKIHDLCQVDSIYIFCMNKSKHEQWANEWFKIKGVFTEMSLLCDTLQQVTEERERNAISISFLLANSNVPNQNLDQPKISFMYTLILKEILLTIEYKSTDLKEFSEFCRQLFIDDKIELNTIDELKHTYYKNASIQWYTRECFLYRMLNQALRLMEIDMIIKMGFFIRNLHQQIEELNSQQHSDRRPGQSFLVYRGQCLSIHDFQQMYKAKGGLLSFNNFLSTSEDRNVSLKFARRALNNPNTICVLFVMTIDPSIAWTPFASIKDVSYHQTENEILFSMHTVFRIGDIKPTKENNRLWEVELTQTSDNDHELHTLTKRIREETEGYTGWDRLGRLFIKLGQWNKAQKVYEAMLKTAAHGHEKANIYNQLGWMKDNQGEHKESIAYYKKSLTIIERDYPHEYSNLASVYNNIGVVYNRMGDYSNALSFYEKALEIRQKIFHPSHPELAHSYNNLGLVYLKKNDLSNARLFLEKARAMREKNLPQYHPNVADSYNNLGLLYEQMKDKSEAQSQYKKAFEIRQKTLPSNHPDLAKSYGCLKWVSSNIEDHAELQWSHT